MKDHEIISDGRVVDLPRPTTRNDRSSVDAKNDIPVALYARRMVLIGAALIAAFYIYKSMVGGGISVTHHGIEHTRTIFAWVDIALAMIAAYLIIRYSRSLIS